MASRFSNIADNSKTRGTFGAVDVDILSQVSMVYKIKKTPVFLVFKHSKEMDRTSATDELSIKKLINKNK